MELSVEDLMQMEVFMGWIWFMAILAFIIVVREVKGH